MQKWLVFAIYKNLCTPRPPRSASTTTNHLLLICLSRCSSMEYFTIVIHANIKKKDHIQIYDYCLVVTKTSCSMHHPSKLSVGIKFCLDNLSSFFLYSPLHPTEHRHTLLLSWLISISSHPLKVYLKLFQETWGDRLCGSGGGIWLKKLVWWW